MENEKIGKICHKKRMTFEKNLDPKIKREMYKLFTAQGIGRTCIIFARN